MSNRFVSFKKFVKKLLRYDKNSDQVQLVVIPWTYQGTYVGSSSPGTYIGSSMPGTYVGSLIPGTYVGSLIPGTY